MNLVHKVIITGTGRAGTTFLVRLLTELGLDTGYTANNWQRDYYAHCEAGLEHELGDPSGPYIIKNPGICKTLKDTLAFDRIIIDHALIPMRDLDAASASRVRVGGANGSVPGGLLHTSDPAQQKAVLAEMFHQLVMTLGVHGIPHTFLIFPRFVQDGAYTFAQLSKVFPNLDQEQFENAFRTIADPELVHTFKKDQQQPAAEISDFHAAQRRKRLWRRVRRFGGYAALATSLALNLSLRSSTRASTSVAAYRPLGVDSQALLGRDTPLSASAKFAADTAVNPADWLPETTSLVEATHRKPPVGQVVFAPVSPEKSAKVSTSFLLSTVVDANLEASIEPAEGAHSNEIR